MREKADTLENCKEDLRKLHGLGEYDCPSNYVRGDGYFASFISRNYSERNLELAKRQLGIEK